MWCDTELWTLPRVVSHRRPGPSRLSPATSHDQLSGADTGANTGDTVQESPDFLHPDTDSSCPLNLMSVHLLAAVGLYPAPHYLTLTSPSVLLIIQMSSHSKTAEPEFFTHN